MSEPNSVAQGPVAIVTGAGRGIGRHVSVALLNAGYRVGLVGRKVDDLQATADASSHAEHAVVLVADVTDSRAVERAFARTVAAFGRLDVLVNNAGVFGPSSPIDQVASNDWDQVVATNLTGTFLCAQAAFQHMKEQVPQGGRIINNGSLSAHTPRPNAVAYTASKHGVTGLTKAIALEGRPYRIVCGQIDIGNAETAMTSSMSTGVLQANGEIITEPTIDVDPVVRAVCYVAALPLDVNVPTMIVMASGMPFVGRG